VPDTFISYRRDDSAGYAGRLREALERRLGRGRIFRDVDTLQAGEHFVHAIGERVRQCRTFLAVIGREWLDARDASGMRRLDSAEDHLRLEIELALARDDLRIVPVLIEGATMPDPHELPEPIRGLAYRHAISLRDDTWDPDVDRLAAAIDAAPPSAPQPGSDGRRRGPGGRRLLLIAGVVATAVALGAMLMWSRAPGTPQDVTTAADATRSGRTIGLPPLPEIAHGRVLFAVLGGSVEAVGQEDELSLDVRVTNERTTDAFVGETSFRLAVGEQVRAPIGLDAQILSGRSTRDFDVRFAVPRGATRATLHVRDGDAVADLPIELSAPRTRREAGTAAGSGPVALLHTPVPLVADEDLVLQLQAATARRFANLSRVTVTLRVAHRGRYPRSSGDIRLRLSAGADTLAPIEHAYLAFEPGATASASWVFDVGPDARQLRLDATLRDRTAAVPLEIPSP
jgi:hypothetical protein